MRAGLLTATALMALGFALPVLAAGRPASEICTNAGFRMGSTAFDMCVARVSGDDPLAALEETGALDELNDGMRPKDEADPLSTMVPPKLPVAAPIRLPAPATEALPPSFNTGVTPLPASPNWGVGGEWVGSPAPTLPGTAWPTNPWWNFGD